MEREIKKESNKLRLGIHTSMYDDFIKKFKSKATEQQETPRPPANKRNEQKLLVNGSACKILVQNV